jgi:subtilisin-like proprotein convertase family protein
MAKTYTAYLPPIVNSTGTYSFLVAPPATIAPNSPNGGFLTWTVDETFAQVEHVIVFINLASTPGLPCNQIELKSPAGTKSILMHAANGFTNTAIANSRFESNAFYGEAPKGTWTLTFFDFCPATGTPTALSTTTSQTLLLVGH